MAALRPFRIVLVRPRNPGNIGASARAMANFGHTDLVLIEPFEPVWKETQAAPGAEAVVQNARVVGSWAEAVADCDVVLGTSSFHQRTMEQAVLELPTVHRYLAPHPASQRVALVFGSERSGLSNEELAMCHAVVHIPTLSTAPSMNLGQAVSIVLYELRRAGWEPPIPPGPAPSLEQESLLQALASLGEAVDYPAGYDSAARLGRIRMALQDALLPPAAVRFLLSFVRKLLNKAS